MQFKITFRNKQVIWVDSLQIINGGPDIDIEGTEIDGFDIQSIELGNRIAELVEEIDQDYYEQGSQSHPIDEATQAMLDSIDDSEFFNQEEQNNDERIDILAALKACKDHDIPESDTIIYSRNQTAKILKGLLAGNGDIDRLKRENLGDYPDDMPKSQIP